VAKQESGGFLAGLVVGGLVGAAVALLATPRGERGGTGFSGGALGGGSAQALFERSRDALRARFRAASAEAERAARETENRLESEYRGGGGTA
jgi:hypothetical protein